MQQVPYSSYLARPYETVIYGPPSGGYGGANVPQQVCVCACVCARARVCMCMCECVCVCVCVCACVYVASTRCITWAAEPAACFRYPLSLHRYNDCQPDAHRA